jgi:DNA-binding MarR family transcriptional regulator
MDYITPAQGRILFALWQEDDVSIYELAKRTSLGKSTLTAMLDRLEQSGHIIRVPSGEDRRKIMIRLTETDRELEDAYIGVSNEMVALTYKGLNKQEIDTFGNVLKRIFQNLKAAEINMGKESGI